MLQRFAVASAAIRYQIVHSRSMGDILALLVKRGGKYPAEHNVGHLYTAPESLKAFYHELDPPIRLTPASAKCPNTKATAIADSRRV